MIDIAQETLISLADASALLPDRPSLCAIWRWRAKGCRGRRLESVTIGGRVYTSVEALQRFARQHGGDDVAPGARTSRQRERAITRAERELERAGI